MMRTTLTLDEDVAKRLKEKCRKTGQSFKQVVNETLREGLVPRKVPTSRKRFRVQSQPLGLRSGLSYDDVSELLDALED